MIKFLYGCRTFPLPAVNLTLDPASEAHLMTTWAVLCAGVRGPAVSSAGRSDPETDRKPIPQPTGR